MANIIQQLMEDGLTGQAGLSAQGLAAAGGNTCDGTAPILSQLMVARDALVLRVKASSATSAIATNLRIVTVQWNQDGQELRILR